MMKDFILKYWVELAFGSIVCYISKKVVELKNKNEATQHGVKALLRDRIIATYDLYIDKGYMPIYARENLQEMYKEYNNLKGNGVIDDLMKDLYRLPTKECIVNQITK